MNKVPEKKILSVIEGKSFDIPPIWLMRQAGRYLPEYREVRKKAGSFLELCYTPEYAVEVSLQPIRRFGFDASILFSDILVIPDAMGRKVSFEEGRGPVLEPIQLDEIDNLINSNISNETALNHLKPVMQTVEALRSELPSETTLLGFCGAPWTVATYMIAGHGTTDQAPARLFALQNPMEMQRIIDSLADISADYLIAQLNSGADAVQIFDSWAGILGEKEFSRWCVEPVKRIVSRVRSSIPDAKIIGFPKGAGFKYLNYKALTGVDALGLDWSISSVIAKQLQSKCPIQGNLDPVRLVTGGYALDEGIDDIIENLSEGSLIFNLGHGITPDTSIKNVEYMLKRIRG